MQQWVPDELWNLAGPLIPPPPRRRQGGGTPPIDARAVFAAIVYVLTTGCAWRHLPPGFGVSRATAHRRFTAWTAAGLWRRLHVAALDQLGAQGLIDWSRATADAAYVRAKKGALTGPSPVDRGKPGSKIHALSERGGLPLSVGVSAANTHDSRCLESLVQAIPAVKSRRGPRRRRPDKLHADKGYDYPHLRRMLRQRGIRPRIARRGIDSPNRLGRHRWVIERTFAWLTGYRRLTIRYERNPGLYCAFLTLAAALTCHKRYLRLTT
ncbi:IS5 family transposase [Micromonospora viridifaciens]|uniref:IS5 family transposase n=1 Tax=Micromonospora viridifaciens TaxID=1881 RepID=UPI001E5DA010|nr:IS5 family transposase [Micromonospora viridifaciens]